jgi:hypothetical protein
VVGYPHSDTVTMASDGSTYIVPTCLLTMHSILLDLDVTFLNFATMYKIYDLPRSNMSLIKPQSSCYY